MAKAIEQNTYKTIINGDYIIIVFVWWFQGKNEHIDETFAKKYYTILNLRILSLWEYRSHIQVLLTKLTWFHTNEKYVSAKNFWDEYQLYLGRVLYKRRVVELNLKLWFIWNPGTYRSKDLYNLYLLSLNSKEFSIGLRFRGTLLRVICS